MIYDYYECNKILDKFQYSIFEEQEPIAYTENEKLPIRHFTLGTGKNHIVITGCQHANEEISTTFILNLMKYLNNNSIFFNNLTIHFIPILNPEGYIVNTSAIKERIKNIPNPEKFYKLYHKLYQKDEISSYNIKEHQKLFESINSSCINSDFPNLRTNVKEILSMHPDGSIINWASNGNGIDLNSNNKNRIVLPGQVNKKKAYNNIRLDIPSPIGYPGMTESNIFTEENEITGLKNLLLSLNSNGNLLLAYLNYHSTGGLIYQRPEISSKNNSILKFTTIYNYLLSKAYQEKAREISSKGIIKFQRKYPIIKSQSGIISSVNDDIRVSYIGDLLIELSNVCSNPLGPFSSRLNYNITIESNIQAFINLMNKLITCGDLAEELNSELITENNIYDEIDKHYKKIKRI